MQQLIDLIKSPDGIAIAVIAAVTIGLMFYQGSLKPPSFKMPSIGQPAVDDKLAKRKAVLALLADAYAYFESEKCPEGMAAVKSASGHVYHEHGAPA